MPTQKLTEKSIRAMPAPDANGKPVIYWDDDLRGFGVLCSGRTNAKTYVVQRGLGDGRRRRVTIAACNVLTLAEARGKAEQVLSDFYAGRDPKAGRKEKTRYTKRWRTTSPPTRNFQPPHAGTIACMLKSISTLGATCR